MKASTLLAGIAVIILCGVASAKQAELRIDSLTVEEAVQLALEHHPSLRAANAGIQAAEAGLTQAQSTYYPSIVGTATGQHTDGAFVFNPNFPPSNQTYNSYSAGFAVQQTLIDFGKQIGRVSANSQFVQAASSDYQSARSVVIMNVRLAYFGLVQAKQIAVVDEEAVQRAQEHLKQAEAFYTVGRRAQFDVTKAEVDLANAQVNAIRSRNQLLVAKLSLDNAMGIRTASMYTVANQFAVEPFTLTLDSVKSITFSILPELLAAKARVEANRSLESAAWDQHLPTLSAFGSANWSNFDFPLYGKWNAGITLSLPIFQGFLIQGQVDLARANAEAAEANYRELSENVLLAIQQAYLNVKEAEERITASTKLVEQAEQNLKLADKQYAAGVGSAIEAADAQLVLSNARITNIQALYDYNSAIVRLRRAMGLT